MKIRAGAEVIVNGRTKQRAVRKIHSGKAARLERGKVGSSAADADQRGDPPRYLLGYGSLRRVRAFDRYRTRVRHLHEVALTLHEAAQHLDNRFQAFRPRMQRWADVLHVSTPAEPPRVARCFAPPHRHRVPSGIGLLLCRRGA